MSDEFGHGLVELEQHVADEAVADQHVAGAADDVPALHVADEVQPGPLEQPVGLDGQLVALPRLLTDVEQPDPRRATALNVLHVDMAEMRELLQLPRSGVDVGPRVQQQDRVFAGRGQERPDRGPIHARQRPQRQERRRQDRPRRPGRDERVRLAALLERDPPHDRAVPLAPHRLDRRLRHADHLPRRDDPDPVLGVVVVRENTTDQLGIPHQHELELALDVPKRLEGAPDGNGRGVVASHRIEGDPHELEPRPHAQPRARRMPRAYSPRSIGHSELGGVEW